MTTAPPIKLRSQSLYKYHISKLLYCMQNFVQFHEIETEIELSQEFWENGVAAPPMRYMYPNWTIFVFIDIYFIHKFLCNFIH